MRRDVDSGAPFLTVGVGDRLRHPGKGVIRKGV